MIRSIVSFLESVVIIGTLQTGLALAGILMLNAISRIGG